MQALEFTRALREITKELQVRELLEVLMPWLNPGAANAVPPEQKQRFTTLLFNSYSGYNQLMNRPQTRKVLAQLGLAEFWEPSRLEGMVSRVSGVNQPQQIWNSPELFRQFFTFNELLRWFQKMESAAQHLLEDEKKGQVPSSEEIVELELIEYDGEDGISAARVQVFVSALRELHLCLAFICGLKEDQLTFKYLDSGSKFTVAVECAKAIAEAITLLLTVFWDKFRFWGHDTFDKNIDSATKSLNFAELVQQQIDKKVITPEEGQNFKQRAFAAVEKLTGIGASIPLQGDLTIDQRKLLADKRDTKLLGTGKQASNGNAQESE